MKKRPNIAVPTSVAKTPGIESTPDVVKNQPLSWGLSRVDLRGEWGWLKLDRVDISELHRELVNFEGETLNDLLKGQEIKDIPAKHLRRSARERLEHLGLEEHDTLWELRLKGKRRAWGLVEHSVFHFLWWDPGETACNPPPRRQRRRRSRP